MRTFFRIHSDDKTIKMKNVASTNREWLSCSWNAFIEETMKRRNRERERKKKKKNIFFYLEFI